MNEGYIKLYRQLLENPLWDDKPFARGQAWADLLLKANYKDRATYVKGQRIMIRRGQLLRSVQNLASDWGWGVNKVRRFLDELESDQMIQADGRAYGTLVTIENYETFQTWERADDTADRRADRRADGTREKNIKNIKNKGFFEAPSLSLISDYVKEMGYEMDPEAFFSYYSETNWTKRNGQPVQDWKAAVRSWERREKQYRKEPKAGPLRIEPPKYQELKPDPEPDPERGPLMGAPESVRKKLKEMSL